MDSRSPPIDFAVRFVEGRGLLGLRSATRLNGGSAGITIDRLELEIPNLRFPFDVSGDATRFQTRRCNLSGAELRLEEGELAAWLASRGALERFGLSQVAVRLVAGAIAISAHARVGERETAVTARLRLHATGQELQIFVDEVRAFGFLPAPPPLLGVSLALGLGATSSDAEVARPGPAAILLNGEPALVLDGIDQITLNPIELLLWRALPPAGWRLPRYRQTALEAARVQPGGVVLTYGGGHQAAEPAGTTLTALHARVAPGDKLLARGDLLGALEAYSAAAAEELPPELSVRVAERRLAVLASMPARFDEALQLGARLANDWPDRLFALLAMAAVESERGEAAQAAARYARVVELADRQGEAADAREAALRAGEEYTRAGDRAGSAHLERVLGERSPMARASRGESDRTVQRALAALAQRYAVEERWRELTQLEKRRLMLAESAPAEAEAHLRLGLLYLEHLGDPARAREELERAVRIGDASTLPLGEAWSAYARALEALGEHASAREALGKAAALSDDSARGVEAHLSSAELAERGGSLESALADVQHALERVPTHGVALERAASLLSRLGRLDEAMAAYERAVEVTTDEAQRAPLYGELARLAKEAHKDSHAARAYVERSLALKPTASALRLAAELAEADGRKDELAELLQRLAATGDREAPLRLSRVLFDLHRFSEAAQAAESAGPRPEALWLLAQARGALGQDELEKDALERLITISPDAEPRLRLGRRAADEGELDLARRYLQEALAVLPADDAPRLRAALESLCDVLLRQGDDGALESTLGRLAELRGESPHTQGACWAAQGAARARLGLTAEAAESFRRALEVDPEDTHARAGLAEAAYALKRWDEARAALEPLHAAGVPPRVERALRLGEIAERQAQPAAAITFYQGALEAGASGQDAQRAWNALQALHAARGDHDAGARALLAAADDERTGETPQQRAGRLVHAADLMRKRAGRVVESVELYERALHLDPFQLAALDALEAIAENDGDISAQVQVLQRKVAATGRQPQRQKAILGRLATLQAERLNRPDAAREAWARALEIDPEYRPALQFLADEARARGDRTDEVHRLEQLTALAPDPADPDRRMDQLLRLGQLHQMGGRPEAAEACGRRVLEAQPREGRALALLDELYTHAGRHADLIPVLALRAQVERDPEQIFDLLLRRASLLDAQGLRAEAITAYEELTVLNAQHSTAWTRLAALLRAEQAWHRLTVVLGRMADRQSAEERTSEAEALYVEVAHLWHDRLGDPARAREVLQRALELSPRSQLALSGLLALARQRKDPGDEDALLGRLVEIETDPRERALAMAERARARQVRGDLDGAHELLSEIPVESAPDLVLKLRVELAELRGQLAEAAPVLEGLRERAVRTRDVVTEKYAVRRLAKLAAERGPSPATEDLLRRAVELDPDDRDAARALAQAERARGDDRAYLESLERLLRTARRTFEGAVREAELCVEMADVLRRLGDPATAQARLREALDATPDNGAAWRALGQLEGERGKAVDSAKAFDRAGNLGALDDAGWALAGEAWFDAGEFARAAEAFGRAGASVAPRRRAEAFEKAGNDPEALQLWRQVGGEEGARRVAQLERRRAERAFAAGRLAEARVAAVEVLAVEPGDEQALEWALQGLSPAATLALLDEVAARVQPADAAALFRRAATTLVDEDARVALSRAALLCPDAPTLVALADRESGLEAARRYQQALQLDPGYAQAALGLARVGLPKDAERALDEAYNSVADARTRARLSAALGQIRRDRLSDPGGAREAYRRAAAESSAADGEQRIEVLRSLAELERASRDLSAAEEALETLRAEGHATDADLRHLAELYAERGAHAQAIELLRGLAGPDASAPELLLSCLEAAGLNAELLELLEKEAPRRMPEEARKLYQRAAAVAMGPLADPQKAAALLEKAVPLGPADAELWARLGRLYAGALAAPDRAARCFARAWAADKSRADVLTPLADFHHELGEWEPSTDYYKLALEHNAVPADDLARVHLRLAEHARHRADAIGEEEALRQAVTFGAADIGERAWKRLAALYRERGDRLRLATALKHLAERSTGQDRVAHLREAVKLVPPDEAQAIDEQLLVEDPSDDAARERILGRLRAAGDQPLLLARLERELPQAGSARQGAMALEMGRLARTLHEDARAIDAYRTALKAAPSLEAGRGLMEVLQKARREHEGALALEAALFDARLAPADRGEVARLAARAYLTPPQVGVTADAGGSGGRALAFFDRARSAGIALQMDPAAYRALLRAELRFPELVQALDLAAAETWDLDARLQLEIEVADVLDKELGQRDEAARRYAGMLDRHPLRRDLAERARQLYAAAGEPIHALAALDKEMRLAPPEDLSQLKIVRGELLLSAGADAEAEAEFLHALITTPRVGRAHAALAEVYKRRGDVAGALEHLIAAADAPDLEPSRAAHCAVDAADVLLKEGDAGTAERLYQLAAALDPSDRDAVEGLARLAAARGDHEKHADLLGRAAMLVSDRRERARLLYARARLFQFELKRELEAYRCLKEAVANDPELAEAARGLRELAEARGEWALAAEQLYREIAVTEEPLERARLHIELGRLLEEKLLDGDDALRNYEQAAEIHLSVGATTRGKGAPWHELVRLYTNGQRLRDAAAALDQLAETLTHPGESRERAEALQRAGELYERSGDPQTAKLRLARAAAIGGEAGRRADDELLRLADQAGDPEELKRRIEERLAVEHEGPDRLALLKRLLELAAHVGDAVEVDMRSQEVLARAPDDPVAFIERKRILEQRNDEAGLAQLLRARAAAVGDVGERAERRFEAGRIAERLGALSAAATDYEEALAADPNHVAALDALADLTFRNRQWARARTLYAQLGDRSTASSLQRDALCQRRAEIAEECGLADEALRLYAEAAQSNPSNLAAHEALARLDLGAGDERAAFGELKSVLDLLPLDAVDRITELRRQLGRLAVKLGETDQARTYFELVLAQDPTRLDALEQLAVLYVDAQMWNEAAESYGRLSYLASEPSLRADLLYRRGEILRLGLEDYEAATDSFLKAADLHPTHAPTLRRLVDYYYREGDFAQLGEVVRELESLPATLDEAAVEAGLGICLGGDEARGTVIVAVSGPPGYRVAEALSLARVRDVAQLDTAIRACTRALGGGDPGRQALLDALRAQIAARPVDLGARQALGRLFDLGGDVLRARMQYAVITFVDPLGPAGTRLRELPPPQPLRLSADDLVHPSAIGPLRDALTALGPVVLGLPPAPLDADPAPTWAERLRPIARQFGVDAYEAAVVVDLLDPAWAEPTRPPRLFLARRALGDEAVARFAAARAFHAFSAGVPLVEGRSPDDVGALLRAAASMFLPDLASTLQKAGAFVHAWQAELEALPLKPDSLPPDARNHLEMVLAAIVLDPVALTGSAAYCAAERLTADRVALALTGDLRAALAALCPADATTTEARSAALAEHPPLVELLAFAFRIA